MGVSNATCSDRIGWAALLSRLSRPRAAGGARCIAAPSARRRAALYAAHAQIRPTVHGADVELRFARLDLGRERLPIHRGASANRPALAADAAGARRPME